MISLKAISTSTLIIFFLPVYAESKPKDYSQCGYNVKSQKLAQLIINDPLQQRKNLNCNSLLAKIADEKAKEMALSGRVVHFGVDSKASNRRLIDAGYPLSSIYPRFFENNVEAIAGGISEPEAMWISFKKSDSHRLHLLAEHEFYQLQDEIGVGFFSDKKSPHVEYWVVYVAHQQEKNVYKGEIAKSKD